jgi:hypothetical protein
LAASPAGARTSRPKTRHARLCPPVGNRTLAASATSQLFQTGPVYRLGTTAPSATTGLAGCLFGHKPIQAGFGPLQNLISDIQLSGNYAAWRGSGPFISRNDTATQPDFTVAVWNLLSGRLTTYPACSPVAGGPAGGGPAVNIDLTASGAAVWVCQRANTDPRTYEVHVADQNGQRIPDASPAIDPSSLAVSAHQAYWLDDGQPQSAPIG